VTAPKDLITTVEDADAAVIGTIALNRDRSHVWQKTGRKHSSWESLTGGGHTFTSAFVHHEGPLVVIGNIRNPFAAEADGSDS